MSHHQILDAFILRGLYETATDKLSSNYELQISSYLYVYLLQWNMRFRYFLKINKLRITILMYHSTIVLNLVQYFLDICQYFNSFFYWRTRVT